MALSWCDLKFAMVICTPQRGEESHQTNKPIMVYNFPNTTFYRCIHVQILSIIDWKASQITQNKTSKSKGATNSIQIAKRPQLEIHHHNPEFHLPSSLMFSHSFTVTIFLLNIDEKTWRMARELSSTPWILSKWQPLVIIGITYRESPSMCHHSIELCRTKPHLHQRRHGHKSWLFTFSCLPRPTIISPYKCPKQTATIHTANPNLAHPPTRHLPKGSQCSTTHKWLFIWCPWLSPWVLLFYHSRCKSSQMSIHLN